MSPSVRNPRIKIAPNLFKQGKSYIYRRGDFEQSLGKFPSDAKAIQAKEVFELLRNRLGAEAFEWRTKDLFGSYLKERESETRGEISGRRVLSRRTVQEIRLIWEKHLRPFFANRKIADIDAVLWNEYCRRSELADLTNHRKVMRTFLAWCEQNGKLRYIPNLKIPSIIRRKRRTLTPNEIKAVLSHSQGSLLVFVSLYLFMGVRRSEQIRAKWENVDFDQMAFIIPDDTTRTRKGRVIPMNRFVASLLAQHKANQVEHGIVTPWVFPKSGKPSQHATEDMPNKAWSTMIRNAGLEDTDIEPHDLRATFEHYANKRADFTDTQREKMAGASIQTQRRIYLHGFQAEDLRGLEEVVRFEGLDQTVEAKLVSKPGEKPGKERK